MKSRESSRTGRTQNASLRAACAPQNAGNFLSFGNWNLFNYTSLYRNFDSHQHQYKARKCPIFKIFTSFAENFGKISLVATNNSHLFGRWWCFSFKFLHKKLLLRKGSEQDHETHKPNTFMYRPLRFKKAPDHLQTFAIFLINFPTKRMNKRIK